MKMVMYKPRRTIAQDLFKNLQESLGPWKKYKEMACSSRFLQKENNKNHMFCITDTVDLLIFFNYRLTLHEMNYV